MKARVAAARDVRLALRPRRQPVPLPPPPPYVDLSPEDSMRLAAAKEEARQRLGRRLTILAR
jgi:hypothetical protein